jgi:hypothetical protein
MLGSFKHQREKKRKKILVTYSDNYNILELDKKIKEILKAEREDKKYLEDELERRRNLDSSRLTYIENAFNKQRIDFLERKIAEIEEEKLLNEYLEMSQEIIKKYQELRNSSLTVKIGENVPINEQRLAVIENYFEVAKKFVELELIPNYKFFNERQCSYCGFKFNKQLNQELYCTNCMRQILKLEDKVLSKKEDLVDSYDSESIENFLKAFIKFQGLQEDNINPQLYLELDNYFQKIGKAKGEDIRKLPLDEKGKRGNTNRNMLWKALSDLGRSEYYEDINLIGKNYWGWKLPNLMHLEARIIDKYIKTQKVFYSLPKELKERNSSLGTQYRLWRHLQLEGYNFPKEEFKLAENIESSKIHEKIWKLMCEGANDPEIYYIPN